MRHFLDIDDVDPDELATVLDLAEEPAPPRVLDGRGAVMLFEKPSLRTRSSMEMAVVQLGGHPVTVRGDEIGLDARETAEDVVRVLSRYYAVVGARVFDHARLERLAAAAGVPVINLLSDDAHPCQVLADLLTMRQRFGDLKGRVLAYIGDGNNVCCSLMLGGVLAGMEVRVATPDGFQPRAAAVERASDAGEVVVTADPGAAVEGADAVYTDVWASMGQEDEVEARRRAFAGFTVDDALMARARPGAVFLHCLPAHRGDEVSASVLEGPQSAVWDQAENRMHSQRGLLLWLLEPE
jgi:ornithine carbamoyltransferase